MAFFSTQSLNTFDALKGHTWRPASFWHLDFLRNADAIPVIMNWGEEVYEALEARTLDGLMVNVYSGYDLKKAGATIRILQHNEVDAFKTATRYQEVQVVLAKEQEVKGAGSVLEKVSTIMNDAVK